VERVHWFAVAGLLGAALAAGVWFGRGATPQPVPVVDRPMSVTAPVIDAGITVHVSGAVGAPGLVQIAAGSRVADAVAAAGGALPTADLGQLNLAATVADGSQIVVPVRGERPAGIDGGGAPGPLRLNSATVEPSDEKTDIEIHCVPAQSRG